MSDGFDFPLPGDGYEQPTPEYPEGSREQLHEEEILAALWEIRTTGGLELKDFIHELEQEAAPRE